MKLLYKPVDNTFSDDEIEHDEIERTSQELRHWKILAKCSLLFIFLMIIASFMLYLNGHSGRAQHLEDGLYPALVPALPIETVTFKENKIYSSPPSAKSNKAWDGLLPPGRGFVFSPTAHSDFHLPQGEITKHGEVYSVTVFHQLHCLGMLRMNYWTLINEIIGESEAVKELAQKYQHNHHTNHCFDYLRQSLQCGADMTLEWPKESTKTVKKRGVDGWEIPHLCKNWDAVINFMDLNHFNDSKRTDIAGN